MSGPAIALVAGEMSGDLLGARLMRAIRAAEPEARFSGIGGPEMQALGFDSFLPMERLSVMGLFEAAGRFIELIPERRRLANRLLANAPDVFVGIDAPDFNLSLERRLRAAGIPTVHYVSPSMWAWRAYRAAKVRKAVDRILTLFPFEAEFCRRNGIAARFVGHPLAEELGNEDRTVARRRLGLPEDGPVVALLPGSRLHEVRDIGGPLLETAAWLHRRRPDLRFAAPMASPALHIEFRRMADAQGVAITLFDGDSRAVMSAAEVVMLASGTASLEAMLLRRPMVVAWRGLPRPGSSFAAGSAAISASSGFRTCSRGAASCPSSCRTMCARRASVHARELPPGPNRSGYFNQLGQHKKSVGIDLSKPEGRGLVRRLAGECDVLVANFGTGVLERMGLGPDDLLAVNPNLTVALVSAFGQDGPWRLYTGYGPLVSPLSGLSAVTGYAEDGRPRDVNMAYGDPNAGVHAAIAIAASLIARDLHGEGGQVIDVSMWEAMVCTAFEGWMNHALGGEPYAPMGNRDPEAAPCNVYACRGDDEWLAVSAGSAQAGESPCGASGRPALAADPRFSSPPARKANEDELDRIISSWCRSQDRWAAAGTLQAAGVPAFPSVSSADLRTDPHLAARGAFHKFEHPEVGVRAHFRVPWRWSRRANGSGRRAPCLGEHTGEVLRGVLGLTGKEVADLHARGTVESFEPGAAAGSER